MKLRTALFSLCLLPAIAFAARSTPIAIASKGLPSQIVDAAVCMVSDCGVLTLIFVIVPAVAVYIYKRYFVVG